MDLSKLEEVQFGFEKIRQDVISLNNMFELGGSKLTLIFWRSLAPGDRGYFNM